MGFRVRQIRARALFFRRVPRYIINFTFSAKIMWDNRKQKLFVFVVGVFFALGFVYAIVFNGRMGLCTEVDRFQPSESESLQQSTDFSPDILAYNDYRTTNMVPFHHSLITENQSFNMSGNGVMVFLHIQKTGGTNFGQHLVKNLELEKPCRCFKGKKRCECYRPNSNSRLWLFSRFSTGWSCGLHADWTELAECVPGMLDHKEGQPNENRRYYYITMLREPVSRYLSEFRHVQRGATWRSSLHLCKGHIPSIQELPQCFNEDWINVSLNEFTECPWNLANNRQTRMIADLTLVDCYNSSSMSPRERDELLLQSAKTNLLRMIFFGLTEYQSENQYLFERTLGLRFSNPFFQYNNTTGSDTKVTQEQLKKIAQLNALDIELYRFAEKVFLERVKLAKNPDRLSLTLEGSAS